MVASGTTPKSHLPSPMSTLCERSRLGAFACRYRLLLRVSDAGRSQRWGLHSGRRPKAFNEGTPREMAGGGAASAERYGGLRTTQVREGTLRRCASRLPTSRGTNQVA